MSKDLIFQIKQKDTKKMEVTKVTLSIRRCLFHCIFIIITAEILNCRNKMSLNKENLKKSCQFNEF